MHAAILIDESRLRQEQRMLNRLCVGLVAEGVGVTRVVEESIPASDLEWGEQQVAILPRICAPMGGAVWTRRSRFDQIAETLLKDPPDVLYASGTTTWALGRHLAQALECPLAIDIWSASLVRAIPRWRDDPEVSAYVAACSGIAQLLHQRVDPGLVCTIPMGVVPPAHSRDVLNSSQGDFGIVVIGQNKDLPSYQALLSAMTRIVKEYPNVHIFLELQGAHEHEIWSLVQKLDLLSHVSAISDASRYRSLMVRCDLMIMPERSGHVRSIVLEAMTLGLAIIAAHDPCLDMLIDGETASVIDHPDSDTWTTRILSLFSQPDSARALGRAARGHVITHYQSGRHAAELAQTLQRVKAGGAYSFAPARA